MFRPSLPNAIAFGLCVLLAAPATRAADPLAERLIGLRADVEALNHELLLLREEQRSRMAGLAAQRAELDAAVERQRVAASDARRKLDEAASRATAAGASVDRLLPVLESAIAGLRLHVERGLPFRVEERLAELDTFQRQLADGSVPTARAVNRLWAFFEDEFRLSRDNSLHSQTIALGDERLLADVAKIGTVQLYFRTRDGRVGQALRGDDGWRFVVSTDAAAIARIATLFDSLHKQIRTGYFELPLIAGAAR